MIYAFFQLPALIRIMSRIQSRTPNTLLFNLLGFTYLSFVVYIQDQIFLACILTYPCTFATARCTIYQIYTLLLYMSEPLMYYVVTPMMYQHNVVRVQRYIHISYILFCELGLVMSYAVIGLYNGLSAVLAV